MDSAGWGEWTLDQENDINYMLQKPADALEVRYKQVGGGSKAAYLPNDTVIANANRIFGGAGWSSRILECRVEFCEASKSGAFSVGCSAHIRITLKNGAFREDIGFCSSENYRQKSKAIEVSRKGAVSDGIKRCLRQFGDALGNCLRAPEFIKRTREMQRRSVEERARQHASSNQQAGSFNAHSLPLAPPVPEYTRPGQGQGQGQSAVRSYPGGAAALQAPSSASSSSASAVGQAPQTPSAGTQAVGQAPGLAGGSKQTSASSSSSGPPARVASAKARTPDPPRGRGPRDGGMQIVDIEAAAVLVMSQAAREAEEQFASGRGGSAGAGAGDSGSGEAAGGQSGGEDDPDAPLLDLSLPEELVTDPDADVLDQILKQADSPAHGPGQGQGPAVVSAGPAGASSALSPAGSHAQKQSPSSAGTGAGLREASSATTNGAVALDAPASGSLSTKKREALRLRREAALRRKREREAGGAPGAQQKQGAGAAGGVSQASSTASRSPKRARLA